MNLAWAAFGDQFGTDLLEITDDLDRPSDGGKWFVVGSFEGQIAAFRFGKWSSQPPHLGEWRGTGNWSSQMSASQYQTAVEAARTAIAAGDVYQVNVCRLLSAEWPEAGDPLALYQLLRQGNPAPMAAAIHVVDERLAALGMSPEVAVASASPELFLSLREGWLRSAPIKGTARPGEEFLPKDISENIMIVDLVRNDLSRVCEVASVQVEHLLERQEHPGLAHLVTTVKGKVAPGKSWSDIFAATFPPGSVTGAPKSSALKLITELEPPRSVYCGTLGVIDMDAGTADLSVAIRTFWKESGRIWFGTGAGITWESDPVAEWQETELKASRLVALAGGHWQAPTP